MLFRKFGRKQVFRADTIGLMLNARTTGASTLEWRSFNLRPETTAASPLRRLWTLTHPFNSAQVYYPAFLARADDAIYNSPGWPTGFNMYYQCTDQSVFKCIKLWRYLTLEDLVTIERDTEASEAALRVRQEEDLRALSADGGSASEPPEEAPTNAGERPIVSSDVPSDATGAEANSDWAAPNTLKRHFEMYRYLARGVWPESFLIFDMDGPEVSGAECGDTLFTSGYYSRTISLEAALVENTSSQPILISALAGQRNARPGLRTLEVDEASGDQNMSFPVNVRIPVGGKVVLPLRIILGDPLSGEDDEIASTSKTMHDAVQKGTTNLSFTYYRERSERTRRKNKSAFKTPNWPHRNVDYVFGPSFKLTGLHVSTEAHRFPQIPANDVALSEDADMFELGGNSDGSGRAPEIGLVQTFDAHVSCPFLYAWDAAERAWVNHGKVIHTAEGAGREATERVAFDGLVTRFRLAEDEPEEAYIRDVSLEVFLADGTTMQFAPTTRGFARERHGYYHIRAFSHREFSFAVPEEKKRAVVRSTLSVTGYYDRHSTIFAERIMRESASGE